MSVADKAAAGRKHLVDKVPVSQIADQMKVQPTLVHNWGNAVMNQAERLFETPRATKAGKAKTDRIHHFWKATQKVVLINWWSIAMCHFPQCPVTYPFCWRTFARVGSFSGMRPLYHGCIIRNDDFR